MKSRHDTRPPLLRGVLIALLCSSPGAHANSPTEATSLGTVSFPLSCQPDTRDRFERGLALMHHMMYLQAEQAFEDAASSDPDCAMLQWGIAMTRFHPLWPGSPSEADLLKGQAAIARARALAPGDERERGFIDAAAAFYDGPVTKPYSGRLVAWADAQATLHTRFPDDTESMALHALAQLAIAPKDDPGKVVQRQAGELLARLATRAPEHPAGFHYLIHAYDNPALAEQGLTAARGYDRLAPAVAHALHMPSHLFVRRGLWTEAIDWNRRSAAAVVDNAEGGTVASHYAHAMDYLVYAHLQRGETDAAKQRLAELNDTRDQQDGFATAYALAASPARFALEQERWSEAAELPVNQHPAVDWERFPAVEGITHFARGVGAARSGDAQAARASLLEIERLAADLKASEQGYWATLARSQALSVAAWIAYVDGDASRALEAQSAAADLEDSVDKHGVTPSAVLPARELYGDLLAMLGRDEEALAAYEAALAISPNRARSLSGARLAAQASGDDAMADRYQSQLAAAQEN